MVGDSISNELTREQRARLFLQEAKIAWMGGSLTRKDRLMLDVLRTELGLPVDETARLEREAFAEPPEPPPPPSARPRRARGDRTG